MLEISSHSIVLSIYNTHAQYIIALIPKWYPINSDNNNNNSTNWPIENNKLTSTTTQHSNSISFFLQFLFIVTVVTWLLCVTVAAAAAVAVTIYCWDKMGLLQKKLNRIGIDGSCICFVKKEIKKEERK